MVSGLLGHVRKGGLIDAKQQLWADGAACKLAERGLTNQDHGLRLRTEHTTHGAVALQRVPYQRVGESTHTVRVESVSISDFWL